MYCCTCVFVYSVYRSMCLSARSHVWAECEESSSATTVLLTDGSAQALLGAHCYEKRRARTAKAETRNPDEPNCPPSVYVWMGCVYAADNVWQGVVGGWCSTAIIWAQGWRVMEEELAKGEEGGPLALFSLGHQSNSANVCMCNCHDHFSGNGALVHLYILALVHLFVCIFCLCDHCGGTGVCKLTCL